MVVVVVVGVGVVFFWFFFGKTMAYLQVSQSISVAKFCGVGWRKLAM